MKLSYKRTIFVGFAFFLICAFWQAYDTIVPKILTDKFGMNQTLSGAIMALDNVLALFMLPLFGSLSDKSKSKRGRRTPFIMTGTIIACAAFICMRIADGIQLRNLKAISPETPNSQEVIYLTEISDIRTPDGESVNIREKFTKEEFAAISMYDENGNVSADYTNYVVPARRACVHKLTMANPSALIMFIAALLVTLIAMSTFRSPAVALMPDVTVKPLRSKANAVINLMGALGGVIVLALGIVFGTGRSENAMMSYLPFFCVIAGIMLVSLAVFRLTVKEPEWAAQAHDESLRLGIENEADDEAAMSGSRKLTKSQLASLILILASVALWYMGYNAVMSKYSRYASAILGLGCNTTLMIATGVAVVSYIPIGFISSKFGRKKTIMAGVLLLGTAFFAASFMRSGSSMLVMNILFGMAGIGWAAINVNSYPMVAELSSGSDVGKYTGFYYTASMAAQIVTPILSGFFMDIKMTSLFIYATVFVALAFVTMAFVRHGDSIPDKKAEEKK